ncbi:MAG TPA: GatB/YqeY domain-containing protein [Candidatus Nitrosotalea sp.]|nr:GatB/YqeY domain-containing protein [Candidatus Nitrosotalea sp.]
MRERVEQDLRDARLARDQLTLTTLGLLKSEIVQADKEPGSGGRVGDDALLRIVRREVKRRAEAATAFSAGGRDAAAQKELAESEILARYLPPEASEEDVEAAVKAAIAATQAASPRDLGRVMKAAGEALGGGADGGRIAAVARRLLGA